MTDHAVELAVQRRIGRHPQHDATAGNHQAGQPSQRGHVVFDVLQDVHHDQCVNRAHRGLQRRCPFDPGQVNPGQVSPAQASDVEHDHVDIRAPGKTVTQCL